ncbi:SusD family protein [Filimonas lacunae]|uniref:SusD family protein n=2 Tax=Filimonas lacunae TaxID=477680 RepID=A0A173MAH6_9BACT|nr:hypothetical protein FLA_0512 [Filimonas lacunae]SIT31672.1 SusD family protein [Filimonas lacunae]
MLLPVVALLAASCKKMFDVKPEQVVDQTQMYRNVNDADAAILGLYGKLMNLAKQHVVLNELRADLMDVTDNANDALKQVTLNNVASNNTYADPRAYYQVILNCNDVIKNFQIMVANKKFTRDEFNQRYGDVVALRSWVYLQAGIQYGTVPYVTSALETIDDVKDESKFPRLSLDKLIDTLIKVTDSIPYKDVYVTGSSLVTTIDGYNTGKFFINKKCLLGDLYLWRSAFTKSDIDARLAAGYYKQVMETGGNGDYDTYRIKWSEVTTNNDIAVGYWNDGRVNQYSENMLVDDNDYGWRSIFARGQDALYNTEWIWMLYFNASFSPENPFIDLFSNRGGSYLVKPSQAAIDGWDAQVQSDNNFPYDARKRLTYKTLDGQPVIMKYLYNYVDETTYLPTSLLNKPGKWFLYRAAQLHLHYAEAANRDGRHKIAYALVNNGLSYNFDNSPGAGTKRDVTNTQQTFDPETAYQFDARYGDNPTFRAPWHRNVGIRGRAHLKALPVNGADSTTLIENMIVDESGLELAYEGSRWADLLRIAIRRNEPAFVADKVYNKLVKDGNGSAAATRARLLAKDWFLPFKWE